MLHRHPTTKKLIDLRLHWMPGEEVDEMTPFTEPQPAPIHRPVRIERYFQLMFLFVNDIYIDVFTAPSSAYDVKLSATQKARIVEALAA
jgi:hypothetical protein